MSNVYISKYNVLLKQAFNIASFPDVNAVRDAQENYNAIYGVNDTYYPAPYAGHKGTDYLTPTGTPIYGLNGFFIGNINHMSSGLGNHVSIENGVIAFVVAHLDSINVNVGQGVDENTLIGYTGNTGYSQGPHLHVQTWLAPKNDWVDSTPYLSGDWAIPYPDAPSIPETPNFIPPSDGTGYNPVEEWGKFTNTSGTYINARVEPNVDKPSNADYRLENGQSFEYDKYVVHGDHIWLRNTANNFWYAWRVRGGEKFGYIE